jgi:pteridine reductase
MIAPRDNPRKERPISSSVNGSPRGPKGIALVTGASHRVGRAVAVELARNGFGLLLTYHTRREACDQTAALAVEAARAAGHPVAVRVDPLDLSNPASVERYALDLRRTVGDGAIDAVVHNASRYEPTPLDAISADAVESAHRVEVVSPLMLTAALRANLERSRLAGGAAVVFFGDMYALGRARAGFTAYMLAKAAVETLARQLAVELAPAVRVHCVAPGVILWPEGFPDDAKAAILARTPLGRAGTPEDAARLVRFLVLEASFMTGETIALDGGRALR